MVKLTAELVQSAPSRINPAEDRELVLRGLRIPQIENLGVTRDCFDAVDLSNNVITRLDNFPMMRRMRCILLANNLISRVADELGTSLPNLEILVLTNNKIATLVEIERLASLGGSLVHLSLLHNPVTKKQNYRYLVVQRFPRLKSLDFQKVTRKERLAAAKYFASKAGKSFLAELVKSRDAAASGSVGDVLPVVAMEGGGGAGGGAGGGGAATAAGASKPAFTPEELAAIHAAIAAASTTEEIDTLSDALSKGQLPPSLIPRFRPHLLTGLGKDAPIPVQYM